jgi:hypothetical protein
MEDGVGNRNWMGETSLENWDKFWFRRGVVPKSRSVLYFSSCSYFVKNQIWNMVVVFVAFAKLRKATADFVMSVWPPVRLSVRMFVCLSVWPPVRLYVCPHVCLTAYSSVCLSACLSERLSVRLSVCLYACPSVCPHVCLTACPSVWPPVRLSDRLSVCLTACPSVYLSVRLSVYTSAYKNSAPTERIVTKLENSVFIKSWQQ